MPRVTPQPQYDLITGVDDSNNPTKRPPSRSQFRESFRASAIPLPVGESDEILRTQLHKLEYELKTLRADREMTTLQHQEELTSVQRQAQSDLERAQKSEAASQTAKSRSDALARELQEVKEAAAEANTNLEAQLRSLQKEAGGLREELDERKSEVKDQERHFQRDKHELEAQVEALRNEMGTLKSQYEEKDHALVTTQQRLKQIEDECGGLENDVLRLKAQNGDADTLNLIKRELSEQVAHIQNLESQNDRQRQQIKKLRDEAKEYELVEERNRELRSTVSHMEELRKELSEARLQRRLLEDERRAWKTLLEAESNEGMDIVFEQPQDLARAYLQERLEKLSLADQVGKLNSEVSEREGKFQHIEQQLATSKSQNEKQTTTSSTNVATSSSNASDSKLKARLERQRALALKEVEYLRSQLNAFEEEQGELTSERFDATNSQRIKELEGLVDQYRNELQTLQSDLEKTMSQPLNEPQTGSKRARNEADDDSNTDRVGALARKTRSLQDELNQVTTARTLLEKELSATKSQLTSMTEASKVRVLELRNNPTAEAARIKQSTLDVLRAENEALLHQLDGASKSTNENEPPRTRSKNDGANHKTVPAASLERLRAEAKQHHKQIASMEKKEKRLKSAFAAQVRQFREATASVLGWDLNILPNDRAKVTSMFDPTKQDKSGDAEADNDEEDEEGEKEERSIIFDAKQGTMKVSGGPQSKFANEIRGLIEFWVDGRKEVPCFLAACTLEFWEKGIGAQTLR